MKLHCIIKSEKKGNFSSCGKWLNVCLTLLLAMFFTSFNYGGCGNLVVTDSGSSVSYPAVITNPAISITNTSAVLRAVINPNGSATDARFEWGIGTGYGNRTPAQPIGAGTTDVDVSAIINGLTPNTVYYYRAVGEGVPGFGYGYNLSFATLPPFPAKVISPSPIVGATVITAPLLSWATANGATSYDVYLGTIAESIELIANSITNTFYAPSSLLYATTYYWRVDSRNVTGATAGDIWTFTTASDSSPIVVTNPAVSVTYNSAILQATVNPNGLATDCYFEYGLTTSYGLTATAPSTPAGYNDTPITASVSGLLPLSLYYYRIVATNSTGASNGLSQPLTTLQLPPAQAALPYPPNGATNVPLDVAMSWATADRANYYSFYLGTYPLITNANFLFDTVVTVYYPFAVSALSPNTTYYWRIDTGNNASVTVGQTWSFTTGN